MLMPEYQADRNPPPIRTIRPTIITLRSNQTRALESVSTIKTKGYASQGAGF